MCKPEKAYSTGEYLYSLEGCEKLKVLHNPEAKILKVEGSLPYFFNGHNFTFPTKDFETAVDTIDWMLGRVGLWEAEINKFEYGAIMPVEVAPKEFIKRHSAANPSRLSRIWNEKYKGKFVQWQNTAENLKLYDAGANIKMKQGMNRRSIIQDAGWNPEDNYIKFEVRYLKPAALLNSGRAVLMDALQNNLFLDKLKMNLIDQYHELIPERSLVMPADKKDFSSLDVLIYAYASQALNYHGISLKEVQKQLYSLINSADCFSKKDKDSRKAQVKKALNKLKEEPSSRWDLTERLAESLNNE